MSLLQRARQVYKEEGFMEVARRGTVAVFFYTVSTVRRRMTHRMTHWGHILTEGKRLRKFRNINAGKRCFIVGNGPSIRQQDLTKLKDEVTFVANFFVLHDDYDKINPTYYCISDPRVYDSRGFNSDLYYPMMTKTRNTVKFFPFKTRKIIKKQRLFNGHSIYYLNYQGDQIWKKGSINLDITKPVDTGDTIIIDFCLPLAFYMGFKEVYLLGCDCDYGLEKDESYKHGFFYDVNRVKTKGAGVEYHKKFWFDNIIKSYRVAKEAFENNNSEIYNAGVGGKLEVFPRVDFERLFE